MSPDRPASSARDAAKLRRRRRVSLSLISLDSIPVERLSLEAVVGTLAAKGVIVGFGRSSESSAAKAVSAHATPSDMSEVAVHWWAMAPQSASPEAARAQRSSQVERVDAIVRFASLTRRQCLIAEMIGIGLSNKEIAARLGISRRTVEHHRAKLMRKVGAQSLAELVHLTILAGLAQFAPPSSS